MSEPPKEDEPLPSRSEVDVDDDLHPSEREVSSEEEAAAGEPEELDLDEVDVKDLLRSALAPPSQDEDDLQRRVQASIRERSKGRFYADGWSTSKAPKETFLVTSVVMLVVVVLVWFLLGPVSFEAIR